MAFSVDVATLPHNRVGTPTLEKWAGSKFGCQRRNRLILLGRVYRQLVGTGGLKTAPPLKAVYTMQKFITNLTRKKYCLNGLCQIKVHIAC
jgi:hypothetical protein